MQLLSIAEIETNAVGLNILLINGRNNLEELNRCAEKHPNSPHCIRAGGARPKGGVFQV